MAFRLYNTPCLDLSCVGPNWASAPDRSGPSRSSCVVVTPDSSTLVGASFLRGRWIQFHIGRAPRSFDEAGLIEAIRPPATFRGRSGCARRRVVDAKNPHAAVYPHKAAGDGTEAAKFLAAAGTRRRQRAVSATVQSRPAFGRPWPTSQWGRRRRITAAHWLTASAVGPRGHNERPPVGRVAGLPIGPSSNGSPSFTHRCPAPTRDESGLVHGHRIVGNMSRPLAVDQQGPLTDAPSAAGSGQARLLVGPAGRRP
jgi:hypothetical protein